MRILITALLSAIIVLSASCKKDKEDDDSRQRKFISLKLDNRVYLSANPKGTIYVPDLTDTDPNNDFPRMEITGQTYTGDVITFTMATPTLPFTPGVYAATQTGNSMLMALNSVSSTTLSSQGSATFYITITRIDNIAVEGTFSGTLNDVSGNSGPRTTKDGAFRAVITQVGQ